jgi:hypothetical protein
LDLVVVLPLREVFRIRSWFSPGGKTMSQKIRCANPNCGKLFLPDSRIKGQRYCSKRTCQRLRKRQWQRHKIKNDPDYRDNQRDAQQCWLEQNRDYWRRYREQHPGYVNRNRLLQRARDRRRRFPDLAKMDALSPKYFLIPQDYPFLAKKDSMDLHSFSDLGFPPIGGRSP